MFHGQEDNQNGDEVMSVSTSSSSSSSLSSSSSSRILNTRPYQGGVNDSDTTSQEKNQNRDELMSVSTLASSSSSLSSSSSQTLNTSQYQGSETSGSDNKQVEEEEEEEEDVECVGNGPRRSGRNKIPTNRFDPARYLVSKDTTNGQSYRKSRRVFTDRSAGQHPGPDDEGFYFVEKVVARRRKKNGDFVYRIRWKGFEPQHDTWEDLANLNPYFREWIKLKYTEKVKDPDKILQRARTKEEKIAVIEAEDKTRELTEQRNRTYRQMGLPLPIFVNDKDENEDDSINQDSRTHQEHYNDRFDPDYNPNAEDEYDQEDNVWDSVNIDNLSIAGDSECLDNNDCVLMTIDNDPENGVAQVATPFPPALAYPPRGGKYLPPNASRGKRITTPSSTGSVCSSSNISLTRACCRYPHKRDSPPQERGEQSSIVTPPSRGKRFVMSFGKKVLARKALIYNNNYSRTKKSKGTCTRKRTSPARSRSNFTKPASPRERPRGATAISKRSGVNNIQHEYNSSTRPRAVMNHDDGIDCTARGDEVINDDSSYSYNDENKSVEDENCRLSPFHNSDGTCGTTEDPNSSISTYYGNDRATEMMEEQDASVITGYICNQEVANGSTYLMTDLDDCEVCELSEIDEDDEDGYCTQDESERSSFRFASPSETSYCTYACSDHHSEISLRAPDVSF